MALPVVVVGSLNVDLVVTCNDLPLPGQTVVGNGFHMFPGGKGANQAVAAARLGAVVRHFGCVGEDANGAWLKERLRASGVDAAGVATIPGIPTGVALITVDGRGQNTIVVVPGANGRCTPELVNGFHSLAGGILLLQLEVPLETVVAVARRGRAAGLTVILNPAPAEPLPEELWPLCDYVIPNETEAALLTGLLVETEEQAVAAASRLVQLGAGRAIITCGRRGAVYADRERTLLQPPWPVEAVDATAAGDAFVGAFAAALARGETLEEALDCAASAGALTAARFGAQSSLPTAAELAAFRMRGRCP